MFDFTNQRGLPSHDLVDSVFRESSFGKYRSEDKPELGPHYAERWRQADANDAQHWSHSDPPRETQHSASLEAAAVAPGRSRTVRVDAVFRAVETAGARSSAGSSAAIPAGGTCVGLCAWAPMGASDEQTIVYDDNTCAELFDACRLSRRRRQATQNWARNWMSRGVSMSAAPPIVTNADGALRSPNLVLRSAAPAEASSSSGGGDGQDGGDVASYLWQLQRRLERVQEANRERLFDVYSATQRSLAPASSAASARRRSAALGPGNVVRDAGNGGFKARVAKSHALASKAWHLWQRQRMNDLGCDTSEASGGQGGAMATPVGPIAEERQRYSSEYADEASYMMFKGTGFNMGGAAMKGSAAAAAKLKAVSSSPSTSSTKRGRGAAAKKKEGRAKRVKVRAKPAPPVPLTAEAKALRALREEWKISRSAVLKVDHGINEECDAQQRHFDAVAERFKRAREPDKSGPDELAKLVVQVRD